MVLPFHSFKVTLGEVLWAPTQIILDELPPSHFLYITAPHHIPRRREGKEHSEGRTRSATPLNGKDTAEGWRRRVIDVMAARPAVLYGLI